MSTLTTAQVASTVPPPQQPAATQQTNGNDTFLCQWNGCGERTATAEALYDHVCERHVGRKSTNNLNLTCGWGNCRTATVKRDHITSHIRVHVPLKPHKCEFCGKAFKRPQDLKKHVKTHAEDPLSNKSPEPSGGSRQHNLGYEMGNGKTLMGDLQALAATATGYYDSPMRQPEGGHSYTQQNGPGFYAPTQQPSTSSYGDVYYEFNNHAGDSSHHNTFHSRRRDFDAMNNFFGDVKRRQFNPSSYAEVGDRLMAFQSVQLPMIHSGMMPEYQTAPATVSTNGGGGGGYGPMPQQQYALPPMANLRTKNDLLSVDQFLEQMQATVYENPNTAAAAGVAFPSAHTAHGGMNFRQSNSPPSAHLAPSHAVDRGSAASAMVPTSSQSTHSGTPALTPSSSAAVSHTPGNSPSATSAHNSSPHANHAGGLYPTLPTTSAQVSMAGYSASSTAPVSVLGTAFDDDQRRRRSGGMLQKASKPPRGNETNDMDTSAGTDTPTEIRRKSGDNHATSDHAGKKPTSLSLIDPSLSEFSTPADSEADKAQETWVENIRVIEALRKFIAEKLEKGEYEDDKGGDEDLKVTKGDYKTAAEEGREMTDAESLYPVLKAVEGHA